MKCKKCGKELKPSDIKYIFGTDWGDNDRYDDFYCQKSCLLKDKFDLVHVLDEIEVNWEGALDESKWK